MVEKMADYDAEEGKAFYPPRVHPVNFKVLLDQVNRIRAALAIGEGKLDALPRGRVGDADQCVLARALSNGWDATVSDDEILFLHYGASEPDFFKAAKALRDAGFLSWVDQGPFGETIGVVLRTTGYMANFILRFDTKQFPDLILKD